MLTTHSSARALGAVAVLGVGLLLAGCVGGPASNDQEQPGASGALDQMDPVVLKVTYPQPDTSTPGLGMQAFADYAREKSGGKLDFEFYPNATLIPPAELLSGLSSGLGDIGLVLNAYAPDTLPAGAWVDQLAPSVEDWGFPQMTISSPVHTRFTSENEVLREELASQNVVPLWSASSGPFLMLCTDPFETPEDLAGRVIRVGGEPWATEVRNLGMSPSFISGSETYEALQRGVIDCTYQDASSILTQGLMDVAKHFALTDGALASTAQMAINKDTWDALPIEAQQILFDAAVPATIAFAQGTLNIYQRMIADAKKFDVTFVSTTEIDKLLQENRKARAEAVVASPPATVKNPEDFRESLEKVAGEWNAIWEESIGIDRADKSSLESTLEAFSMGPDAVDWEAYEAGMVELVEPARPRN